MNRLFSYEGWYYRIFTFIADLIILNLLFWISAMTVVLIGPALITLYHSINRLYHEKEIMAWKIYWQTFRANLKRGFSLTGIVLVFAVTLVGILYSLMEFSTYLGFFAVILFSLSSLLAVVFIIIFSLCSFTVKKTVTETLYVVLSSTANAIILLVIPVVLFVLLSKVNLFLFFSVGMAVIVLLQVIFFNKVLIEKHEPT